MAITRRYQVRRTSEGKTCSKCNRFLSLDKFGKNATERDGLAFHCYDCVKIRSSTLGRDRYANKISNDRLELKRYYINLMGGGCIRCGYNEFVSGIDFHHLEDKKYAISALISAAAQCGSGEKHILKLEQELAKCVALCRNCHSALHGGELLVAELEQKKMTRLMPTLQPLIDETTNLPLFESEKE